ncbi:MAG: DUF1028 domain-containing protein [Methanomassiliicoccus sp.]|nr:DUF1028 domain-containing protein [Methanomassiliicoccus sp.]
MDRRRGGGRPGAAARPYRDRLAHTYSIVARDPVTGEMGAAVQSHWFSVGSIVTWGEAGVGVVATQSMTNPSFGPRGLELLRQGTDPAGAVKEMISADEGREVRQLAVLDLKGRGAAYTGSRCIPRCGHIVGEDFSVQANMMSSDQVWPAMARAFEETPGPLAERMVAALVAAEDAGGDFRGSQSASLLVVKGTATGHPWEDRPIDLRVEDHADPVGELGRLLRVHRAYEDMNEGDLAVEKGDMARALRLYGSARERCPDNEEMVFWTAAMLASNDRLDESVPLFTQVFHRNPRWREALPDLARLGHVRIEPEQVERIVRL